MVTKKYECTNCKTLGNKRKYIYLSDTVHKLCQTCANLPDFIYIPKSKTMTNYGLTNTDIKKLHNYGSVRYSVFKGIDVLDYSAKKYGYDTKDYHIFLEKLMNAKNKKKEERIPINIEKRLIKKEQNKKKVMEYLENLEHRREHIRTILCKYETPYADQINVDIANLNVPENIDPIEYIKKMENIYNCDIITRCYKEFYLPPIDIGNKQIKQLAIQLALRNIDITTIKMNSIVHNGFKIDTMNVRKNHILYDIIKLQMQSFIYNNGNDDTIDKLKNFSNNKIVNMIDQIKKEYIIKFV
mgnify:CR=1 FL=1